jgi:DNA-binding Lrp family transcriptional regulator
VSRPGRFLVRIPLLYDGTCTKNETVGWAPAQGPGLRCQAPRREAPVSVSAYILIQTEVGKAAQVADEVGNIEGVVSAEDVTGPYDVIARSEANTVDELGKMVVSRVQMIAGITRTLTCPVVHLS